MQNHHHQAMLAEVMSSAGTLPMDSQLQLLRMLSATVSGASQAQTACLGTHQGSAFPFALASQMAPSLQMMSALRMVGQEIAQQHLPQFSVGADPVGDYGSSPSPSSGSAPGDNNSEEDVGAHGGRLDSKSSGDDISLIFTRRRAGQKARFSNEPVSLSRKKLQEFFDLPLKDAASILGISMTALKKACRRMGLERWPYRKVT